MSLSHKIDGLKSLSCGDSLFENLRFTRDGQSLVCRPDARTLQERGLYGV